MKKNTEFLLGAATAAHQVEGNNIYSDFWAMEQMKHSTFSEPSLDAVDHYHRYQEDIMHLKDAGLNTYRFSIEWARIEPYQGKFSRKETQHYRNVILFCKENGIMPVVTLHHFSSPKWVIERGGWENEEIIDWFKSYCRYIVTQLQDVLVYVCTINELNMGLAMNVIRKSHPNKPADLQIGILGSVAETDDIIRERENEYLELFGVKEPQTFLAPKSPEGDRIIARAHAAARSVIKEINPDIRVGASFSLHDFQAVEGGEQNEQREWEDEFLHYLPYLEGDDFIGVQNYTRKLVGAEGYLPAPEGAEKTLMHYEFYPEAVGNVVRRVAADTGLPVLVTENGISTKDDERRDVFIRRALSGVMDCKKKGVPVLGYIYWSLLDNFEWQSGYSQIFGLIAVDRTTMTRHPKKSLYTMRKVMEEYEEL